MGGVKRWSSSWWKTFVKEGKSRHKCTIPIYRQMLPRNRNPTNRFQLILDTTHSDANIFKSGELWNVLSRNVQKTPLDRKKSDTAIHSAGSIVFQAVNTATKLNEWSQTVPLVSKESMKSMTYVRNAIVKGFAAWLQSSARKKRNTLFVAICRNWIAALTVRLLWATVKIGWRKPSSNTQLEL